MANLDAPKGAVPVQHLDGSPWNGKVGMYLVPSSDGTAVFVGDFVKLAGSAGSAGTEVNGIDCEGIPTIAQAAAGDTTIVGVVVGFLADQDNLMRKHRAASTNRIALVADGPDVVFEIQEDSDGAALAVTDTGNNADIVVGTGSSTTGLSAMEIDSSSKVATTAQLRLLNLVKRPDNTVGNQAKWHVMINEHVFKTTAGV
jgi:hypothetical protein